MGKKYVYECDECRSESRDTSGWTIGIVFEVGALKHFEVIK